jgi:CRISPR/Cas system-associated protein Cas5 (RAMP superfamily)
MIVEFLKNYITSFEHYKDRYAQSNSNPIYKYNSSRYVLELDFMGQCEYGIGEKNVEYYDYGLQNIC